MKDQDNSLPAQQLNKGEVKPTAQSQTHIECTKELLTKALILLLISALILALSASATMAADNPATFSHRNMGGPRLGITIIPGKNDLTRYLEGQHIGKQLSQFGWHFEYQIIPRGGGPQFVIQATPLIGGVEYGKVIPGATLAMGIRFPNGFEFGLGPNVVAGTGETSPTSLVAAVGKSFDYGGVSIPLNLAYATNPDGSRLSLIIGYAIDRR